jgi:hypothetical protein
MKLYYSHYPDPVNVMPRLLLVRPWTDAELVELRSLWDAGVASAKIARRLRCREARIKNKARLIGLPAQYEFPRKRNASVNAAKPVLNR